MEYNDTGTAAGDFETAVILTGKPVQSSLQKSGRPTTLERRSSGEKEETDGTGQGTEKQAKGVCVMGGEGDWKLAHHSVSAGGEVWRVWDPFISLGSLNREKRSSQGGKRKGV